jgi:uncharacterized membrane protein
MAADAEESFARLLYRYWFFGWLFRDAQRGTALQRAAALRHNREQARWLPTYMLRWAVLGLVLFRIGVQLEFAEQSWAAMMAFVPACLTVSIIAVAIAGWLCLRRL